MPTGGTIWAWQDWVWQEQVRRARKHPLTPQQPFHYIVTQPSDVSVQYWGSRLGKHKLSGHHPPS